MSSVVVVESPSKAKTINKYLGSDYTVLASFGHVRDLPSKDGSVKPDNDFEMVYQTEADSKKHITAIANAIKDADHLYLATDPDREGEAISWHVLEALKESKKLPKNLDIKRIVFHEITKRAVTEAIEHPRDIDMNLVNAQQARRALDYLVGFTLSPVLWRKLPGSKSAGRVQSVALRLVCEREAEIKAFVSQEYWDISAQLANAANAGFKARLTHWQGEKLEKFSIPNEARAKEIVAALEGKKFSVGSVEPKQTRRNPYAPFTTSTLQQDSSRRLGFGAKQTMQIAQKLYEEGFITYMRTDSVSVSTDAIAATRSMIGSAFGDKYVPSSPRMYKTKTANAQEAHEAIRPTDVTLAPERSGLNGEQLALYTLIWKRMVASQMEAAVFDQVSVDLHSDDKQATLRANGSVQIFDGFLKLYQEGRDDDEAEDENDRRLPALSVGEAVNTQSITPEQHFTEPPPRYTEASLVKKLEELGIGRPSTYASIISVLQDRGYVRLDKKRFVAEMLGKLVNAFLVSYFEQYVEYDFTAELERHLDEVSEGNYDWKTLLRDFWKDFIKQVDQAKELKITDVLNTLDAILEPFIFGHIEPGKDHRACPKCGEGRLSLKSGKFGAFLGCSNYPECKYTQQLSIEANGESGAPAAGVAFEDRELGTDPASSMTVHLKKGPYGIYVQLGEEAKPKRSSLPRGVNPAEVTLEQALGLLALPREVGMHPETGKVIKAGIGRFGPYLFHDGAYVSLKGDDDVLTVGINRAVTLIAEKAAKGGGRKKVAALRVLGKHPDDDAPVELFEGKYGPYVKHGKKNATLPKGQALDDVTLEQALELLAAKKGKATKAKKPAKAKKKA